MLEAAAVLLAVAAIGGLTAAVLRVRSGANPPLPLALIHGAVAAVGLLLVLIAGIDGGFSDAHAVALALLVVAALGGFVLFAGHLRNRLLALPLVGVHAVAAVAGFVSLLVAVAA
jgi:hypothetical protein